MQRVVSEVAEVPMAADGAVAEAAVTPVAVRQPLRNMAAAAADRIMLVQIPTQPLLQAMAGITCKMPILNETEKLLSLSTIRVHPEQS